MGCGTCLAAVAVVLLTHAVGRSSGLIPPIPLPEWTRTAPWCRFLGSREHLVKLHELLGCDPYEEDIDRDSRLPECGISLAAWKPTRDKAPVTAGVPLIGAGFFIPQEDGSFRCLDGVGSVPASAVNDDFCDCADGSDEPGTAACSHLPERCFFCENKRSVPRVVYASRIGDGICDCCDGSDEASVEPNPCANTCEAEGAAHRAESERRKADALAGLKLVKESQATAPVRVAEWKEQAAKLKAQVPELQKAQEEAKKRRDELQSQVDAERAAAEAARKEQEATSTTAEASDGDTADVAQKAPPGEEAPSKESPEAGSEPVVSEYAKWALDREARQADTAEAPAESSRPPAGGGDQAPSEGTEEAPAMKEISEAENSLEDAKRVYDEANHKLRVARSDKQALDKKSKLDLGEGFRWFSLVDACVEKVFGEYNYKVCFFDEAKQDRTLLGTFSGWDEKDPMVMRFTNGRTCPGGAARSLRVRLECAAKEELRGMLEPSRCTYEARLGHPAGCTEQDVEQAEEPPEKNLQMPRDEL